MLRIALCDDDKEQRAILSALLRDYLRRPGAPQALLWTFSSGLELLSAVEDKGGFDLYILDVIMPEMSGIQLGKKLRGMGSGGAIVYLSFSREYALDSYEAQAFSYLLRPVQAEDLYQVLDRAVVAMEKHRTACIAVKTKDGSRLLRLDEIQYVELVRRKARYYLSGGEQVESVTLRVPFREAVSALMEDPRFFLCGSSFVVNLYYVIALENGCFLMDGGARLAWARGQAPEARQRWSGYWLDAAREEDL